MGLRAKKHGLNIAVTNKAISWHQHINPPEFTRTRHPFSAYLIGRNKVYLAYKHFGLIKVGYVFAVQLFVVVRGLIIGVIKMDKEIINYFRYMFLGAINGLFKNMKENKYSFIEWNFINKPLSFLEKKSIYNYQKINIKGNQKCFILL